MIAGVAQLKERFADVSGRWLMDRSLSSVKGMKTGRDRYLGRRVTWQGGAFFLLCVSFVESQVPCTPPGGKFLLPNTGESALLLIVRSPTNNVSP